MWLALVPFAAFAGAFLVGAVALWILGKRSTISQTETKFGKTLHLETPVGTLDVRPQAKLDPRLAPIPIYPGAMPENIYVGTAALGCPADSKSRTITNAETLGPAAQGQPGAAVPTLKMAAESVTDLRVGCKTAQDISATYWTSDNEKQVWDFYRQQLPDWPRNLAESQGKELIRHEPGWTLLIRISSGRDRTLIETSVKPPEYPYVFG